MPTQICHEGNVLSGQATQSGAVMTFSGTVMPSGREGIVDDVVAFTQVTDLSTTGGGLTIRLSGVGTVVEPGRFGSPFSLAGDWQRNDELTNFSERCFSGPFQACTSGGQFDVWILREPVKEYKINLTTFIPGTILLAPSIPRPRWAGIGLPLNTCMRGPLVVSPLYIRLDDRGFDPDGSTYRTRQLVTVIPDQTASSSGEKEGTKQEALAHPTKVYADDALPVIDDSDDDAQLDDCHLLHKMAEPIKDMKVSVRRVGPKAVEVHLFGHAGTTFPNRIFRPCPISWDITLRLDTSGPRPTVEMSGWHDGFPAYELYVNNRVIHRHRVAPLTSLFEMRELCGRLSEPVAVEGTVDLE